MYRQIIIGIVLVSFLGCQREKLDGQIADIVGEWEMIAVYEVIQLSDGELAWLEHQIEEQLSFEIKKRGVFQLKNHGECLVRAGIHGYSVREVSTGNSYGLECPKLAPYLYESFEIIYLFDQNGYLVTSQFNFATSVAVNHIRFEYHFVRK